MAARKRVPRFGQGRKRPLKGVNTASFVLIPIVVVGGVFLAFSLATGTAVERRY